MTQQDSFWNVVEEDPLDKLRDIVDVSFRIACRSLPLDHAYALSESIQNFLPWLSSDSVAGIHLVHGAESGNGWMRPQDTENDILHLSRRARLRLRVSVQRIDEASGLVGKEISVAGFSCVVGEMQVVPLEPFPTVFSRYVLTQEEATDRDFLEQVRESLHALGIDSSKLMSGRGHQFRMPDAVWHARSVMVAGLSPQDSLRLQRQGIGHGRDRGFGLFIGHRDIAPVGVR